MRSGASIQIYREPRQLDKSLFANRHLIGIDGDFKAGKSHLAKEIKELVGGTIIELDRYLDGSGRPFLEQYKDSELVVEFHKPLTLPRIVEGVVLLDAFAFLDISPDVIVFATKHVLGEWEFDRYIHRPRFQPRDKSTREILDYYQRTEPWKQAQLCTALNYEFRD